ncbi:hypothetical protein GJ496_001223 [Pomphorhynchus laevis]|nr:hypothetical protein GJ496_001223 [Pomphorhynchus laevis]
MPAFCKSALIIIDMQNDFINGSLRIRNNSGDLVGQEIIPVINSILSEHKFDIIVYSLDWHPIDHLSFHTNSKFHQFKNLSNSNKLENEADLFDEVSYDQYGRMKLWPDHCIQDTEGSQIHKDLHVVNPSYIIYKGTDKYRDGYSVFTGKTKYGYNLEKLLNDNDIGKVFISGLALDYCVRQTSMDSVNRGYHTFVILDATRSVTNDEDYLKLLRDELIENKVHITDSRQIAYFLR